MTKLVLGKRPRRSRAEWASEVARWRSSGQSAERYAHSHALNSRTLSWWACQLEKETRAAPHAGPSTFLPVVVAGSSAHARGAEAGTVEVVLTNGRRICVSAQCDTTLLARLVEALEGNARC